MSRRLEVLQWLGLLIGVLVVKLDCAARGLADLSFAGRDE